MATGSSLADAFVTVSAPGAKLGADLEARHAQIKAFASRAASTAAGVFAGVTAFVGAKSIFEGTTGLAGYAIKLAADAEQAKTAFTVMLGSAEKAGELTKEINAFAAATPFQTTELIAATKALLAFGTTQDQIIPTMRVLGDLSSGLKIPIGELSELYGKAMVQGRLYLKDVNELTGRGIPVMQEFAKQFGVTEGEVRNLVEQGKIGFPQVQKALVSLTAEGSRFGGGMEAQSRTLAGLYSTLKDTIDLNLTKIGLSISENLDLKGAIEGTSVALGVLADAAIPKITELIAGLADIGVTGSAAGDLIVASAEKMAQGIALVQQSVDALRQAYLLAQVAGSHMVEQITGAAGGKGWNERSGSNLLANYRSAFTTNPFDDMVTLTEEGKTSEFDALRKELQNQINDIAKNDRMKDVGDAFEEIRVNAMAARIPITNLTDDLNGVVKAGLKIREVKAAEATWVDTLDLTASSLEGMNDLIEQAGKLWEKNLTPLEKYKRAVDDMDANPFVDDDTRAREMERLQGELQKSMSDKGGDRNADAVSRRLNFIIPGEPKRRDPLVGLAQQAVAEHKAANIKLDRIVTNLAGAIEDDEWDF